MLALLLSRTTCIETVKDAIGVSCCWKTCYEWRSLESCGGEGLGRGLVKNAEQSPTTWFTENAESNRPRVPCFSRVCSPITAFSNSFLFGECQSQALSVEVNFPILCLTRGHALTTRPRSVPASNRLQKTRIVDWQLLLWAVVGAAQQASADAQEEACVADASTSFSSSQLQSSKSSAKLACGNWYR